MEELTKKQKDLLDKVDWYYHYADDPSAYRRGKASYENAVSAAKSCKKFKAAFDRKEAEVRGTN